MGNDKGADPKAVDRTGFCRPAQLTVMFLEPHEHLVALQH